MIAAHAPRSAVSALRHPGPVAAFVGILTCLAAAGGQAAGLRDCRDGWVFSPREFAAFLGRTAEGGESWGRLPGAGTWVSAGHTRLFDLADLCVDYLAAGARVGGTSRPLTAFGSWQRTHGGLLQENQFALGLTTGRNPEVGVSAQWWSAAVMGDRIGSLRVGTALVGWTAPLASSWQCRQELSLDLWAGGPGPQPRRTRKARTVLWSPRGGLALAWDRSRDGSFQVGLEVLVAGSERVGLLLRADPATGCLGPGVAIRRGPLLVLTSHVQHPDLGPTHRILLVAGERPGAPW